MIAAVLPPVSDYAGIQHIRGTCHPTTCPFCRGSK